MPAKFLILISIPAMIFIAGCEIFNPPPQMTSLQIQAIQTREFETSKAIAFSSTMAVLQDLGYIISMASIDTGFITAESPSSSNFFMGVENTKVTAYIQSMPNGNTKIRLNFVTHAQLSQPNGGGVINTDTAIYNPQPYQEAFNKIQQQIFIQTPFKNGSTTPDTMMSPGMPSGTPSQ
ncbi:MAG: hypothetical protein A2X47_01730 [Lentisphaerae bacterium GWF2_38_69]|nr:MAG: hypothetical protein A2X47_01730 [Lentisphaerae bacterium GWF2_38_69]